MTQMDVWDTHSRHDPKRAAEHPPRGQYGRDWYHADGLSYGTGSDVPAFLFWAAPPLAALQYGPARFLREWADGRCYLCGFIDSLVQEHDHQTGRVRGYTCRECNSSEAFSDHPGVVAWREWANPVALLGLDLAYRSPVTKGRHLGPSAAPPISDALLDEIADAVI